MKLKKVTFILLIVLAFVLRFYWLTKNPPALNIDEVSIGYNAYSILHTGKDEYGKQLPLLFRSYDDYKPPLYVYLVSGSMFLFGPTDFAVRFPAAILGVFSVGLLWFFVRRLFPEKHWSMAAIVSFLLCITPWHLQFTRAGFEVGTMACFTVLGLLFLDKRPVISALIFGVELFVYQASRIFVPAITLLAVIFIFRISLRKLFGFGLIFLIFFLPIVYISITPEGQARMKGASVLQDFKPHENNINYQITDWLKRDRWSVYFFHEGVFEYSNRVLAGYFSHFNPDFLFLGTNNSKINLVPQVGLLNIWELPFLAFGFLYMFRENKRLAFFLSGWILVSPIPAALTYDVPSSIRVATMLPALQIVTGYGIIKLISRYFKFKYLLIVPVMYFFIFYLHMSYFHGIKDNSRDWYYSYKQLAIKVFELSKKYPKVIVSTKLDQPQAFFLYYTLYDPSIYLNSDGGTVSGHFAENRNHFANIYFMSIAWDEMQKYKKTLFVGKPGEFPDDVPVLARFNYLDGKPSSVIVEK